MNSTLVAFSKAFPNPAWPMLGFLRDTVQRSLERFGPIFPVNGERVLNIDDLEKKLIEMYENLARRMPTESKNIEAAAMAALDGALLPWYRANCAVEYEVKEFSRPPRPRAPRRDDVRPRNPSRTVADRNRYPVAERKYPQTILHCRGSATTKDHNQKA
jgi:hypothetical protein